MNVMESLRENGSQPSGLAEVLQQAWPAALTMLMPTVTRFVDGLMVSHMGAQAGAEALAAQSIAGIVAFVPESLAMGMLTVVSTYISQNVGAGRDRRCGQYVWAGMILAIGSAFLIALTAFKADWLFSFYTNHTSEVRRMEAMYYRYMVVGAFFSLPTRVLDQFFFGIHRPRIVFRVSMGSAAVNVLGNYALIYGRLGLPAMGLEGAAISSVASWGVNLVLLTIVFLRPTFHRRFLTRFWRLTRGRHVKDILAIGYASGLQFCNEILGWSVFMGYLVGKFGTVHLAASTIAMRYMSISFMPAVGINIAATAIVGKYVGAGRHDLARRRAHTAVKAGMVYMGTWAIAFLAFGGPLVRLFTVQAGEAPELVDQIVSTGRQILICAAVFQLFDALGIVYVGALRGAGDTRWPMVATILMSWGVTVGGGLAMVRLFPALESLGPWIAASVYVSALGLLLAWRFESGAWENIDLLQRQAVESSPAPQEVAPTLPESLPAPRPKVPGAKSPSTDLGH